MKNFFSKLVCVGFVAILLLASGCTTKPLSSSENQDGLIELSFYVDLAQITPNSNVIKKIENDFGIKVKLLPLPPGNGDDVRKANNLLIASGDIPDIIQNVKFPEYISYAQQGIISEVPKEMIQAEAPKIVKWVDNFRDNAWEYYKVDGKNYVVPSLWLIGESFANLVIRQDWLEEVGITKIPETLDEIEVAMQKVKQKRNIYPMTGYSNKQAIWEFVYGSYDLYPGIFTEKNGKIVRGEVEPEAKLALEYLNRWYKNGLIDPEFIIDTEAQTREKWIGEKALLTTSAWYHTIPTEAFWGGIYYTNLKTKNPNSKPVAMIPPKGPNGQRGLVQDNPMVNAGMVFGKQMKDQPEKMKKYLQIADTYLDINKPMNTYINYGVKGETYEQLPEVGFEWISPYDKAEKRKEYGIGTFLLGGFTQFSKEEIVPRNKYYDTCMKAINTCVGKFDVLGPIPRPIYDVKKDQLMQLYRKNTIQFITGERPLSEFDNFVKEWMQSGGKEALAEAQQYYDRMR